MSDRTEELASARDVLTRAERVVVLTGSGISADSGVPTFRGPEGLWKSYRPEELATPEAFARDPRLVWEWYAWRREIVAGCEPNAAHLSLARWRAGRTDVCIVTQNVDGLHTLAATEVEAELPRLADSAMESRVIELHGSLFRVRCTACPERREHRGPVDVSSESSLPRCESCGGLLRPDVVWFGEPLPEEALMGAFEAARRADACLVVGTSGVVYPAAGVAAVAAAAGAALVEVNPTPTPLSGAARISLRARAAEVVPALLGL